MSFPALLLLALGLSMDAFAVSISQGASMKSVSLKTALRTGLVFGIIEGVTPLAGWLLGSVASRLIVDWSHWLAFVLLLLLGIRMIYNGWQGNVATDAADTTEPPRRCLWLLILTAITTSIDALAIGIGLAFLQVNIFYSALAIGCVTALMSALGILGGHFIGNLLGRWAEFTGGLVLVAIGWQIIISHFYA